MKKWAILGVIWLIAGIRWYYWNKTQPIYEVGQTIAITMRLSQWPEIRYGKQIIKENKWEVQYTGGADLSPGKQVRIVGKLGKKVIRGEYVKYYLISSDIRILQESNFRQKSLNMLKKWLPGDMGVLVAGILLGGSEGLSEVGKQAFKNVGLTHVVAASGYNVGVVAGWVMGVGWRIWGRRKAIPFVLFSIVLYMVLAGGSAAVVRAGLMAMVTMIALSLGRPTEAGWWLAITSGGMLIGKPEWLGDVGFQLSVAAMAGLIWIEPRLWGRWQDMRTTIAAQLSTIPLILHYFGNLSIVSPLVNGLLLWTVPPIMQVSAIALSAGLIWEPMGRMLAYLVWPLVWILAESTKWIGRQSWSAVTMTPLSWWWVVGYYLTLIIFIKLRKSHKK